MPGQDVSTRHPFVYRRSSEKRNATRKPNLSFFNLTTAALNYLTFIKCERNFHYKKQYFSTLPSGWGGGAVKTDKSRKPERENRVWERK